MATSPLGLVKGINHVMATASGRDKVSKVLQYSAQVLSWYHQQGGAKGASSFMSAVGSARRVDRMFGTFFAVPPLVEDIKSFAVLLETGSTAKPSEFIFASLSVTASFCDCLYYLLDNATWLASVDVIQMDSDRIRRWGEVSSWCWMVSLLVCITKDARSLTALQRERKQRRRQSLAISDEERNTIEQREKALYANFVKNFADLQLAIWFCLPNAKLPTNNTPCVGVFGVIAALAGIYQLWPRRS